LAVVSYNSTEEQEQQQLQHSQHKQQQQQELEHEQQQLQHYEHHQPQLQVSASAQVHGLDINALNLGGIITQLVTTLRSHAYFWSYRHIESEKKCFGSDCLIVKIFIGV
jgi:hypothetical protein